MVFVSALISTNNKKVFGGGLMRNPFRERDGRVLIFQDNTL